MKNIKRIARRIARENNVREYEIREKGRMMRFYVSYPKAKVTYRYDVNLETEDTLSYGLINYYAPGRNIGRAALKANNGDNPDRLGCLADSVDDLPANEKKFLLLYLLGQESELKDAMREVLAMGA